MDIIRKERGFNAQRKVFLSYNEHDAVNRDKIIADLLSMDAGMDCRVSYLEASDAGIDREELENELQGTQLLVLCVTEKMLNSISYGSLPAEYNIVQKLNKRFQEKRIPNHISILPILFVEEANASADRKENLFSLYTEKFGPIHCITASDSEYRADLKSQMENFLPSDDLITQIQRNAFTAKVFVGYRRTEISEARRFMKIFHALEGFESISVFYDKFLTAGEEFNERLRESIKVSDAFILIVTPYLATKDKNNPEDNYVQAVEYPIAKEIGKPVVPVETIPTCRTRFAELFPGTERAISVADPIALRKTFVNKLGELAFTKQMDSERAYLLGMAYLKGIGVESDFDRALRLLELARNGNGMFSEKAKEQLDYTYKKDYGVYMRAATSDWLKYRKKLLGGIR